MEDTNMPNGTGYQYFLFRMLQSVQRRPISHPKNASFKKVSKAFSGH